MKETLILVVLMVHVLFLNISSSEIILVDPSGQGSVSHLPPNSINMSVNNMEPIVSLSGQKAQNISNEANRNPEEHLHISISNYSVNVPPNNDPTDIYFPDYSDSKRRIQTLPFALVLQGANVDKSFYRGFAKTVASYGFVVVVPNHESTAIVDKGLYAEEQELNDIHAFMTSENANSSSPLYREIDTSTMLLLGHSYGGVASLYAIEGKCQFPFCTGFNFHRPTALKGGAFYGTNLKGPTGSIPELDNNGIPIALVQGSRDGMATPAEGQETFYKIKNPPKAFITIEGANHYGITDVNNPQGAKPDKNVPLIPQNDSIEKIGRLSALFLRAYILGDEDARTYIIQKGMDS